MKVKFDINYLYIIGTIFVIAIFISLFAVTVTASASAGEAPSISFGGDMGTVSSGPPPQMMAGPPITISSGAGGPPPMMSTEPPMMMSGPPPMMSTEPPMMMSGPPPMMATAPPTMEVHYTPSGAASSAQYEPPMMQATMPTKVNPILTKVPKNAMHTPPSDVIFVQNNSTGRPGGSAGVSTGTGGGLTQGLITKKA